MERNSVLYGFVFHFNPYKQLWFCASRDHYNDLFSGGENTISSSNINTLVKIVIRTQGDFKKALELIDE